MSLIGSMGRLIAIAQGGHIRPWEWAFEIAFLAFLAAGMVWLYVTGNPGERRGPAAGLERIADSLRRLTGLPAWCAAGIGLAMWALLVAGLGFYWDVAWHIDFGRDRELFTPPHMLILTGLAGIGLASLAAIALATFERAETGLHMFGLRAPYSAVPLGFMGLVAVIGFPLDDLWHRNYGIDVTMWSPTHLMMIGAASFTPVAMALMSVEGGRRPGRPVFHRAMSFRIASAALIGLSTFQLEFDLGVPQWQALYQPVLIMAAGSLVLVAVRTVMGRFSAIYAALSFIAIRIVWALIIGPGLGHSTPHFALYLGVAAAIELGAFVARGLPPLRAALVMGGFAGTLGLASEWGFSYLFSPHPWQAELLPNIWVAVAIAVVGAVIGMAAGRVMAYERTGIKLPVVLLAAAAFVALLAVPFARTTIPIQAHMTTSPSGDPRVTVDQYDLPGVLQDVNVNLTLNPPDAAEGADWFEVISWQGGSHHNIRFIRTGPGTYRTDAPVPTGSTWKSIAFLAKGSALEGVPIYMPSNPDQGQPEIPVVASRDADFNPSSAYLVRAREGGGGPASAISGLFFGSVAFIALLFLLTFIAINRQTYGPEHEGRGPTPALAFG